MTPTPDYTPGQGSSKPKRTHRHRPTLHKAPQTFGFKEERKLSARRTTAGREKLSDKETDVAATAKNEEPPWQPQRNSRTKWSLTRSYGQNGDDGCVRNPSSRPKSITIPGKTPTVDDNGPVERRAADTAWNDTAKRELTRSFQDTRVIHALHL